VLHNNNKGWATRAPVAQTLQSVPKHAAHAPHARVPVYVCHVCISIFWNFFKPTRTVAIASETTKLKQQGDGAGEI
jgi:hypothetical protein